MKKRSMIGVLAVALLLIGAGCESSQVELEAPSVACDAVNDGGTLRLSWDAVDGVESYEIKAGDST